MPKKVKVVECFKKADEIHLTIELDSTDFPKIKESEQTQYSFTFPATGMTKKEMAKVIHDAIKRTREPKEYVDLPFTKDEEVDLEEE